MAFPSWLPLGLAIKDYFETKRRSMLSVHTLDGDTTYYPSDLFFREYEDFSESDEMACTLAKGRVLDAGAGAGCISLYLKEVGLEVTPIDIAHDAVEVMHKSGLPEAREGDIYSLKGEKWDTILLLMNGIGIAGTIEGLEKLLEHLKGLVAPGGQVLFDSSDLDIAEIDAAALREDRSNYHGEVWFQLEYKGVKGEPYHWLYIDSGKMMEMAENAGWVFEMMHESEDGNYLGRLTLP